VVDVLRAVDIEKSFRRKSVLRGANLSLAAGESVAIVGENGSGKSTLLNICAGVMRPDAGSINVDGATTRTQPIGYCPQIPGLVDLLNAGDHLRLVSAGIGTNQEERTAALQRGEKFLSYLGFDLADSTAAKHLSGGQRQKLNLALTMMHDPQLLLLDEPYQGFDHGTYVNLWDQIDRWTAENRGVIIITHLLPEQDRVDRVLRIDNGRLVPA